MLVVWDEPLLPNGVILNYSIERRVSPDGQVFTVATVPAAQMQYTDQSSSLSPFTTYDYRIIATSAEGSGTGPWASVTTISSGKVTL